MAEAVISMMLVSVLLVTALNTVGASRFGQYKMGDNRRGHLLARQLMAEILGKEYEDPDEKVFVLSLEADELFLPRSAYDDVDDYDGWEQSPPQYADGTPIPNTAGWRRTVEVVWADRTDFRQASVTETGIKRITVGVSHNGRLVARDVALKAADLPPPDTNLRVLFVVVDPAAVTAQEDARKTLIESWGYTVVPIAATASQVRFDNAAAQVDVAYVSEEILAADLSTKLFSAPIGVVNEDADLVDDLGFTAGGPSDVDASMVSVIENTHFITKPFLIDRLVICLSSQPLLHIGAPVTAGLVVLAEIGPGEGSLCVIESGDLLADGSAAAGRRVQLPWGGDAFDVNSLALDGQTLMKRSIVWAAGRDAAPAVLIPKCGDATCDAGEDSCSCPADCGAPALAEVVLLTCGDNLDNDCDGRTDCQDPDCLGDALCPLIE